MDNKLKELIVDSTIATILVTTSWGFTNSILSIVDPDEPCGLNIFGIKPSQFVCCISISSITTLGVIWSLILN